MPAVSHNTTLMCLYKPLLLLLILQTASLHVCAKSDTSLIRAHLSAITKSAEYRTHDNVKRLNETADYIHVGFARYADTVYFQEYEVDGKLYKNVICSFNTHSPERIVIGAHYDVCGRQEGADDNASGVAGLLELARLLKGKNLKHRIDLVAYTLEEPPYFRTESMGSYVHAKWLSDENVRVLGMVSLEMIGYFREEKHTQNYPLGLLSLFYGNRGNYITLVKKYGAGRFARKFTRSYKRVSTVRAKKFAGPSILPGIDFSDHLNYWHFGYSALMITDTSFYRNANYHEVTDTMETLDFGKMAKVIDGVLATLVAI